MAYELLFLPSFIRIFQLLQITLKVLISPKDFSKNASLIIPKTTHTGDDTFYILRGIPHRFRQFIMRHVQLTLTPNMIHA
ncbi:hypothetical protein NS375_10200 [Pantoea dispersa]|nr:hypothetical protein NS375_10200 [Pantoea dispersa]